SEKAVRETFRKARQAAPCIIFFDEIDALIPVRTSASSESHVAERVLSQFLSELDGIEELKGVLVLGATNRLDMLDPAVLRPGRFDETIEIPMPHEGDRKEIFEVHLRNKPLGPGVTAAALSLSAEGLSGAEIASVCNRAALRAVHRAVEAGGENTDREVKVLVELDDLESALEEVKKLGEGKVQTASNSL
ncbi:MAG: AAA family ATPase, partial [Syntrophobacteria bacterium]